MISTRNLQSLPGIPELRRLSQSLALLDAIIEPEWELRYYSFDAHWNSGETMATEAMASMCNGEGDDYFLLFNAAGAILKGFAHESLMASSFMASSRQTPPRAWPGVLDSVPEAFSSFLVEPAFSIEDTTFCLWRTHSDAAWQRGDIHFPDAEDPDGSEELLAILDGNPRTYQEWAQEYYERPVDLAAITHIYQHRPLTAAVVKGLNEELDLEDVAEDARQIGY